LLCIAAAVSLALGLYQDFGTPREHVACADGTKNCLAPQVDWVEGVAILAAVSIVVIVGSVNDWQKERQFKVLNAKKEDRSVIAIRNGQESTINVKVRSLSFNFFSLPVFTRDPTHRTLLLAISAWSNLGKSSLSMVSSCEDTTFDATNLRPPENLTHCAKPRSRYVGRSITQF
jgi:hypothetical protein